MGAALGAAVGTTTEVKLRRRRKAGEHGRRSFWEVPDRIRKVFVSNLRWILN
jgi:hypothetical protein